MRWIVSRSLRFRWLVLFAATALMVFGVTQIPNAKVDVFPEFAPPQVEIQTIALGNSSDEVEEFITVPIEEQLQGIDGLDEMRSKSVSQLSSIRLIFEKGTDEHEGAAARAGAHRAGRAQPADVGEPAVDDAAAVGDEPDHEDRAVVEGPEPDRACRRSPTGRSGSACCACPGVAAVDIYGERLKQRHVQVDPAKLAAHGVSLDR